jgi:hypothetical protein
MSQKRKEIKKDFLVVGEQAPVAQNQVQEQQDLHIPISFDAWWLQTQSKYKFKPELKEAIKKHFMARGFINDSSKFEQGLKDFGYNIPNLK